MTEQLVTPETTATVKTIITSSKFATIAVPSAVNRNRAIKITQEKERKNSKISKSHDDSYVGEMLCDGFLKLLCPCF